MSGPGGREGLHMLTRRDFIRLTGATTIGWYVATQTGWVQRALAQVPGGTLEPGSVTKYVTPLLIPPVMPRARIITLPGGKPADY
ncbi:MAG TPA: twin-arginine translocation signal domain-containing protein, partial [Actinomycetota bacterium]|nr:twin-arginine translocation signal domain-containing protein [Actinomycetota bacterium]